jgi:hypothetical protein
LAETFEPVCFGPRIERARGLVENDDRALSQKRARECDALPLADAELCSACEPAAEQRLFFFRQARNDLFGAAARSAALISASCCVEF